MVKVGGTAGCVFAGEVPETFCFVPQECIVGEGENIHVAELDYVARRWDQRNMRSNLTVEAGSRLFPDPHRPVENLDEPPVRTFLYRLSQGKLETFGS